MLRNIYYALSPQLRLFVRKLVYWPVDLFSPKNNLIPPKGLIYTGRGDFLKAGKYWTNKFIEEGGLLSDDKLLDIGSGIGRMAVGLTSYLKTGEYEGFDAVQQGVDWCQINIQSKFPNFQFKYVDLSNDLYKSSGIDASKFAFPYSTGHFNFAISISVFTHMLPHEINNYLAETARTLKPGGILFATFFIIEKDQINAREDFSFPYDYGHYYLMDQKVKSANVALDLSYLMSLIEKNGFILEKYVKGYWQKHVPHDSNDFQDYLILKKK